MLFPGPVVSFEAYVKILRGITSAYSPNFAFMSALVFELVQKMHLAIY